MPITEYIWKSHDGLDLYAVEWPSDEKAESVVAFVHGHGDHCRRYDEWFASMNTRNISVVALDYRGHGQSEGKRGTIRKFDDLLKDISLLHLKATALNPGIPVVLYGHSLGGTIVLSYLLKSPSLPALAIVTSPWLQLNHPPGKFLSAFIKIANMIIPNTTFSTGLHSADFSDIEGFSNKRDKDKFVHNQISPRLMIEVEKEVSYIFDHFSAIKTPLLLLQGRDDKIMDGVAPRRLNDSLPGQVNYREWKYAGHQLHFSERNHEIMDYIVDWIKTGI
jgi:alpha-beta hydrolase superfamily lysophospholipase